MKESEEQRVAKSTFSQVLAALVVSLGSMFIGFSTSYSAHFLKVLYFRFEVDMIKSPWFTDLLHLITVAGGLTGGLIIGFIGRKNTILATAVGFITSWVITGFGLDANMLLFGRGVTLFFVGLASVSLPVYLAEAIQPKNRGILVLLTKAFGDLGMLVCTVSAIYTNWIILVYLGGAISILFLVLMFLLPETPRWYISQGRTNHARKALVWLTGKDVDVEPELNNLLFSHSEIEKNFIFLNNLKAVVISISLMFFHQLSGVHVFYFFANLSFQIAGISIDGEWCNIIITAISVIATFFGIILIDKLGRKALLYISNIIMIVTLFTMGGYVYVDTKALDHSLVIDWIPLTTLVIYIIGYSTGFGTIPWLMMGEILPSKIRGPAAGIVTAFNFTCLYLVTKFFNDICDALEVYNVFWLNGFISIIGFFFIRWCVPETKGLTLEDIEHQITGRERRVSSVENIYPQLLKA